MTTPQCEKCGGRTYLSRRESIPGGVPWHEIHTYRCASCEHCQQREDTVSAAE